MHCPIETTLSGDSIGQMMNYHIKKKFVIEIFRSYEML